MEVDSVEGGSVKKVKRGARGQHHRATPSDLRDRDDGLSGEPREGVAAECEVCGGPVPMWAPGWAEGFDGVLTACLACGTVHEVVADDSCAVCNGGPSVLGRHVR